MRFITNFFSKVGIATEFLQFLWRRRLWWLIPLVIMLLALGLLMVLTQGVATIPFIYTLF